MAWSDNLRCLYCDGKLPLYRKITSGQFCSAVHRKAYWHDQERLAVERLHQTHDSLRAYRVPEALEAILGKPAASEPVSLDRYYLADQTAGAETKPSTDEIARSAANTGKVRFAGFLTEDKPALRAWEALLAAWDVEFAHWPMSAPSLPASAVAHQEHTLEAARGVAMPQFQANGLAAQIRADAQKTGPVEFIAKPTAQVPFAIAPDTKELSREFLETLRAAEAAASAPVPQAIAPAPEPTFPFAERQAALPKITAQPAAFALRASEPLSQQTERRPRNARYRGAFAIPAVAAVTRMEPLPMTNAPRALAARAGVAGDALAGDLKGYSQPLDLKTSTGAPWMNLAIAAAGPEMHLAAGSGDAVLDNMGAAPAKPGMASGPSVNALSVQALDVRRETATASDRLASPSPELSLHFARGCRYDIPSQPGTMQSAAAQPSGAASEIPIVPAPVKQLATQSLELNPGTAGRCEFPVQSAEGIVTPLGAAEPLAAGRDLRIVPLPDGLGDQERNPATARIVPLAFAGTPCAPSAPRPVTTGVAHVSAANAPMNPVAKWQPLDGSATPPPRQGFLAGWSQNFTSTEERKHVWAYAADFIQHAPRDLKLLAIAIPILLALALRPSLPKVRVSAPASSADGISKNIGDGFRQQFVNVRNTVAERAAVALNEDFRSGLDDWQTRGDLSAGWSFDGNGFVRPATLALYRPSLGLTDYEMQFLGLIDKKALSWVVRAQDFDNYYVVKLVITRPGPLPTIGITRYAVIDGKAQDRVDTIATINARPDMLYRVSLNVHDDTYLLALQGTIVDNWTETRLKRGGVGFFAAHGEESRLRWLQVTHQYDMLGRLCAYLAPYNIPTTDGSW